MFKSIKNFLSDMLTETDNETYEIGRFLWAISVMLGLTLESLSVLKGYTFDLQAYGVGAATLLGAGGVINALKVHVENMNKQA